MKEERKFIINEWKPLQRFPQQEAAKQQLITSVDGHICIPITILPLYFSSF